MSVLVRELARLVNLKDGVVAVWDALLLVTLAKSNIRARVLVAT